MPRLKRKSKNSIKRNKAKYNDKEDQLTYNFNSSFEVRPIPVITSLDYSEFDNNFGVEDTQTIYYKV